MALYVLNTTRSVPREDKNIATFLSQPKEQWIDSCYAADGPHFQIVMALIVMSPNKWKSSRVKFLQRLLMSAHVRSVRTHD